MQAVCSWQCFSRITIPSQKSTSLVWVGSETNNTAAKCKIAHMRHTLGLWKKFDSLKKYRWQKKQAPLDNNACKYNKNNTTQFNTTLPNYNTSQKCAAFQKHEFWHHGNNQPCLIKGLIKTKKPKKQLQFQVRADSSRVQVESQVPKSSTWVRLNPSPTREY